MASASDRFILSPDQINAYLIRICHPKPSPEEGSSNVYGLGLLTSLQRQHLAYVPFENLSIHYSTDHAITLDPKELYTKIVTRRRGGYCMENNLLFRILLRSLGFTVYSVGGRVSNDVMNLPGGGFSGWYVDTPPSFFSSSSSSGRRYHVKSSPTCSALNNGFTHQTGAPLFL